MRLLIGSAREFHGIHRFNAVTQRVNRIVMKSSALVSGILVGHDMPKQNQRCKMNQAVMKVEIQVWH